MEPKESGIPIQPEQLESFREAYQKTRESLVEELRQHEKEYHNFAHSTELAARVRGLLQYYNHLPEQSPLSDRVLKLVDIASLAHDIDQTATWEQSPDGIGWVRKRNTGAIEEASAEHGLKLLENNGAILSSEEQALFREVIRGTIPEYNQEKGYLEQIHLRPDSHPAVWAVATIDMATPGYNTDQFLQDGDALFSENYALPPRETLETYGEEFFETLCERILDWNEQQIRYAEGQKQRFLAETTPVFIRDYLQHFDKSIKLAGERYNRRYSGAQKYKTYREKAFFLLDDMKFRRYGEPDEYMF